MKNAARGAMGEVKAVVNLSSKMVAQATQAILYKGLNFAIAPPAIPFKESALKDLPLSESEEVRGEVAQMLKTVDPLKLNLSGLEKEAL